MKIGIIVYSQTGNTYLVAQHLKERLEASKHTAVIERVTVDSALSRGKNVKFTQIPAVEEYDALVFGSPVHAFSLAQPMAAYLKQLPSLQKKKAACFVTKQLPFSWTGGNRALSAMKKICASKGAKVSGSGIVVCSGAQREQNVKRCVEKLAALF
jgi:NAD(P)H dehydrogenase (quinone)